MIISHKYKFLFIGLPFSASSAIIKDLHDKYEGKTYLSKHSLYHEFKRLATKKEKDYFVFSVLRNPMDIIVTSYFKMKLNPKGNFTNPKLFKENGGHITRSQRAKYNFIKDNNATFQQYFLKFYKKPYDNLFSLTSGHCDFIIQYKNIDKDYILALEKVGISNPTPLPKKNKTIGKDNDILFYYSSDVRDRAISVFGPFMKKYNLDFPISWGNVRVSSIDRIKYNILVFIRKIIKCNFSRQIKRKSIAGTIYGGLQRKKD